MKAFITGSHAYGTPNSNSDVDLVILVGHADLEDLEKLGDKQYEVDRRPVGGRTDSDPGTPGSEQHRTASVRFGRLNLICTTDPIAYGVWLKGTRELERREGDTSRDEAVAFFRALRAKHGISDTKPTE